MPYKTCEECGEKNGPRAKRCKKCSASFGTKTTKSELYPEPGEWIEDRSQPRLPKIEPSQPLGKTERFDNEEIRDHIAYEGLGFCVYSYIGPNQIIDPKLRSLWADARIALRRIIRHIDEQEENQIQSESDIRT
jgi:ribosomal protein L40E